MPSQHRDRQRNDGHDRQAGSGLQGESVAGGIAPLSAGECRNADTEPDQRPDAQAKDSRVTLAFDTRTGKQRRAAEHREAADKLTTLQIALEDVDGEVAKFESEIDSVRQREYRDRALLDAILPEIVTA